MEYDLDAVFEFDELDQATAQDACTLAVYTAIADQLERPALRTAITKAIQDDLGVTVFPSDFDRIDTDGVLLDALPTLGKSYSAARVAAYINKHYDPPHPDAPETIRVAILTHRIENREARKKDAQAAIDAVDGVDLEVALAPSATADCPAFSDTAPDSRARELYSRGLDPTTLHTVRAFATDLSCAGSTCQYMEKQTEFREDPPAVVIGHPRHAHLGWVTNGRIVLFDEDVKSAYRVEFTPDESTSGPREDEALHSYLSARQSIPATTHDDLVALREDSDRTDAYRDAIVAIKRDLIRATHGEPLDELSPTANREYAIHELTAADFEFTLTDLAQVGDTIADRLRSAGYDTIAAIATAEPAALEAIEGIGTQRAQAIYDHATARTTNDPAGIVTHEFDHVTGDNLNLDVLALEHSGHALAPLLALAVLVKPSDDIDAPPDAPHAGDCHRTALGNNTHYIALPGGYEAVFDKTDLAVYLRRPPDLTSARAIIALDGTPSKRLWEGRLDCTLTQRSILADSSESSYRSTYIQDVLEYDVIPMSTHPRSRTNRVNKGIAKSAIELAVTLTTGRRGLITSKIVKSTLLQEADDGYPLEAYLHQQNNDELAITHYGMIRSSNAFKTLDVGIVYGYPHPGDDEIRRLAALQQDVAVPSTDDDGNRLAGMALSYGIDGDPYLRYFREHRVTQAVFRFGRQAGVAPTVFVYTAAVPDWLTTHEPMPAIPDSTTIDDILTARKTTNHDDTSQANRGGQFQVMIALADLGAATTTEVKDHDAVDLSWPTTKKHLNTLNDNDLITKTDNTWHADTLTTQVEDLNTWWRTIDQTGTLTTVLDAIHAPPLNNTHT